MSPWLFLGWAVAVAVSVIAVTIAIAVVIAVVKQATGRENRRLRKTVKAN